MLVIGSSWQSKDWLVEGYRRVAESLLSHGGVHVVLVGDRAHAGQGEQVAEGLPGIVNLVGRTNLGELLAVLKAADVVAGPDSGPAHLCSALGVPHVTLFGPTSEHRTAPHGNEELVIRSHVGCRPCYRRSCPGLGTVCMRLISPDEVIDKVRPFIEPS